LDGLGHDSGRPPPRWHGARLGDPWIRRGVADRARRRRRVHQREHRRGCGCCERERRRHGRRRGGRWRGGPRRKVGPPRGRGRRGGGGGGGGGGAPPADLGACTALDKGTSHIDPPPLEMPGYLQSAIDPTFGTKITRVSGDVGDAIPAVAGYTWRSIGGPAYS